MLNRLRQFVNESNNTNSSLDKLEVIRKFSQDTEVMSILSLTYSPYRQYYVTSQNCKKRSDLVSAESSHSNIIQLLNDLSNRVITGHDAIRAVNSFVANNLEYQDLIYDILDRNLKTRSTATMINNVVPGFIPEFNVALSATYNESTKKKVNLAKDDWYVSRKLDGVRCIAYVDEYGNVTFFSRAGKQFETLDKVAEEIRKHNLCDVVLDGEICLIDENGNENFQDIIKEIKRKNHTIQNPMFLIFDLLTLEEFDNATSTRTFSERQAALKELFSQNDFHQVLTHLPQSLVKTEKELEKYIQHAAKMNWEGLMLRKDAPYQGKRSNDIMKIKSFYEDEYRVVDVEFSVNRVIVNGKEVEEEMLSNIVIFHRGNRVQVGSGFSLEERRLYYRNPELILNKVVTVQYFEETKNQTGTYSLRFPVIKAIHGNEREL